MRRWNVIVVLALSALMCLGAEAVWAQDVAVVGPNHTKVRFVNKKVRITEISLTRHAKLPAHSNPACVIYPLQGGELTMTYNDGQKKVLTAKTNEPIWSDAEKAHTTENTGKTKLRFLLIELYEGYHPTDFIAPTKQEGGAVNVLP
jgi:hypothetical protein